MGSSAQTLHSGVWTTHHSGQSRPPMLNEGYRREAPSLAEGPASARGQPPALRSRFGNTQHLREGQPGCSQNPFSWPRTQQPRPGPAPRVAANKAAATTQGCRGRATYGPTTPACPEHGPTVCQPPRRDQGESPKLQANFRSMAKVGWILLKRGGWGWGGRGCSAQAGLGMDGPLLPAPAAREWDHPHPHFCQPRFLCSPTPGLTPLWEGLWLREEWVRKNWKSGRDHLWRQSIPTPDPVMTQNSHLELSFQ